MLHIYWPEKVGLRLGDYAPFWALRSRFVTQMFARGRALHSRNGWGFAAGGGGDSLPGNFLVVPR